MTPCGPPASTRSRSWRPRWTKPLRSRPVARCSSVEPDLLHREPRAHGVDRHPRLDAEPGRDREDAARARARQPALAGERLARRRARSAARISARAAPFAIPKPPPARSAKRRDGQVGARVGRAGAGRRGGRRRRAGARPAELPLGERQRLSLAAAREAEHASRRPPRRARRWRRASRRRRRSPRRPGTARAAPSTVAPIRSSSSRAATRTVSSAQPLVRPRLDRRQHASSRVGRRRSCPARRPGTSRTSASAPAGVVDAVDGREPGLEKPGTALGVAPGPRRRRPARRARASPL